MGGLPCGGRSTLAASFCEYGYQNLEIVCGLQPSGKKTLKTPVCSNVSFISGGLPSVLYCKLCSQNFLRLDLNFVISVSLQEAEGYAHFCKPHTVL